LNRSRTHAIANIKDSDTTSTNDGENENADFIDLVHVEIKEECHFILFLEKERFDNTLPSTQTSKFTGHRSTPSGDSGPILLPDWTVSHVTAQSSGRTRTGSILVMMD
jgi:hypothetical protein